MHVVGRHQRGFRFLAEAAVKITHFFLLRQSVIVDLQKEILRAQNLPVFAQDPFRVRLPPLQKSRSHFTFQAGARSQQALRMFRQQLVVDPRLVVNAFQVGGGHQPDQVPVALQVSRQQQEVVVGILAAGGGFFFKPVPRGHVNLATHDGFDPGFRRRLVKFDRPVKIAVIRQRQGRLAQFLGPSDQFGHPARPVQQGVLGVTVQMDKRLRHRRINLISETVSASQNPFFSAFFGKNY